MSRHPRARGLGRHDRLAAGDCRRGRHRDRRHPSGPQPQPVDEPRRVGRRARDQRRSTTTATAASTTSTAGTSSTSDAQPQDGNGHGTHVSGTIAARGNDATRRGRRELDRRPDGAARARRQRQRLSSRTSSRPTPTPRATARGWSTRRSAAASFSRAEHDAIAAAPSTLFVVAAGNDGADNDATPEYPCNYDLANVVCVAASDRDDSLASFSNYGADERRPRRARRRHRQHVAGRRVRVLLDGTSMATPHVSGAAALLLAHDSGLTVAGLRSALLSSTNRVARPGGPGGHRRAPGRRRRARPRRPRRPGAAPAAPPRRAPAPAVVAAPSTAASAADRTAPGRVAAHRPAAAWAPSAPADCTSTLGASEACRASIEVRIDARSARRLHLASRTIGRAERAPHEAGEPACDHRSRLSLARRARCAPAKRLRVVARAVAVDASRATIAAPSARRPCGAERRRPSHPRRA